MKECLYEVFDKKQLRQKCARCGKSYPSKELINCFKERCCRNCVAIKRISRIHAVIIPQFMLKEHKLDTDSLVVFVSQKNGILIKKYAGVVE